MQKSSLTTIVAMALTLIAGQVTQGQSAYFQAVTNLNPAGYWPLNETAQPPQPLTNVANNLGTLGAAGNGRYGAWYQAASNSFYITNNTLQTTGATADGDVAMNCPYSPGQYIVLPRNSNGVANSALTITPPFSVEAWVKTGTIVQRLGGIVSEGEVQLNAGGPNTNDPFYGGLSSTTVWAGFAVGQYSNYFFFSCFDTNAYNNKANELDGPKTAGNTLVTNQWVHLVCTFDGVHEVMYENAVQVGTKTLATFDGHTFVADPTSPLMIGSGSDVAIDYGNPFQGVLDEVAIYTNVLPLTSIVNHYQTAGGTNATYGANYTNAVLADSPLLYFRMDDPVGTVNAGYPSSTFPVATNYGSTGAAGNGVYQPGTTPGVAGPSYVGFGANSYSVAINGWFGAVDVGNSNLPAALNPTGIVPMSIVSWFQSGPADAPGRFQEIVGHSDNSYRLALGSVAGENHFNPGPGPELQFTTAAAVATNGFAFNDGNWHMVAGVTDGTNEYMYLDGRLAQYASNAAGINIRGTNLDLLLGGDPEYTFASTGTADTIRNFDGQIAHVAVFSNALSAVQVQSLYNAAGVPPTIVTQPLGATNNQGATVTLAPVLRGSQTIFYQWYTNGVAVAGQTNENLVLSSSTAAESGNYYLVATNLGGSVTSAVVSVVVYGSPVIVSQTQPNLEIYAGSSPVLDVVAAGAPPLHYQWYSNSAPIASATSSSYTVANVQNTATYTCTLTNFVSATPVTTSPITLTVLPDPTAPYPAQILANGPLAFWRLDESSGLTAYDYIGGNNGTYTNASLDFTSSYNPNSDPTEGGAPGFGISPTNNSYVGWVPTNINFAAPTNVNAEFSVECWLYQFINPASGGDDAGVISLGYGNGGEEFALDTGATGNDLRFYVRNAGGTSYGASSTVQPAAVGGWHHVVGVCDEAGGTVYIYIDGTNAGVHTIPSNSGILTSVQSLTIGARQEGFGTPYDFQFIGAIDEVAVYNYALSAAEVQRDYFATGIAPVITQLTPASQTANQGGSATFTATATGTPPLSYQWYDPNNNLLSTNATLVISDAQQSSQGNYEILVSNLYGTATANAYLSVNLGPPQLVQDISPLMQTVELYSGFDTVSYTFLVSGTEPFAYQWYMNGTLVAGATNSTYTFTALPGTNTYYASVTNASGGPLTSSTATVVGIPEPQLNPANYAYRAMISFPGYTGNPLTDFPALIELSQAAVPGLSFNQFQTNGSDLRFTDASGTAMLPYEIDEWNDSGVSSVWVQIPLFNGTNIWAYWGNPNDTDVAPASSNVWVDAGYQIVYHMKESAFPFADSTGGYPATNGVAPTPEAGIVGHAGTFNGTSDYITPGIVTLSNQFTAYAWINIAPTANNEQTMWVNQVGGYGDNGFSWYVDSYQTADRITRFDSGNGAGSGADPSAPNAVPSGWHFMVSTWDQVAGKVTNYLDAAVNGTGTAVSTFSLTNQLNLGAFLNPTLFFNGEIDEARIQPGLASTNWITTTYLNIWDQSSFVGFSSVNLEPTLSIASATNGYVLSWPTNDGAFTLEVSTNVNRHLPWPVVTGSSPVLTNGVWEQIVQPAAGKTYFYILQRQ